MSTRSRPPRSSKPGDYGPEEPTEVEDPIVRAHDPPPGEFDTPVDVPFCYECAAVVVLDDYNAVALHAFPSHCLRARSGRWWWCSKFRKSVTYVPE